jgi:hypothetical protein
MGFRQDPHLTSPWEGEGPSGGCGDMEPFFSSPFQGEDGWGSLR